MNKLKIILNGITKENPTFVLLLGMCPTLGTTTSAENGMGMGLATMFVLICSNIVISLIKNIIPDKVRIPAFIVIIATFVTVLEMCMKALLEGLGIGIGFTLALTLLGALREFLGTGKIFNMTLFPENYGILIFILAPGAFIALGYLIVIVNKLKSNKQ